jgi:hypothetical protein
LPVALTAAEVAVSQNVLQVRVSMVLWHGADNNNTTFCLGEVVSLEPPAARITWSKICCLTCLIISNSHSNLYHFLCEYSILKMQYQPGELRPLL